MVAAADQVLKIGDTQTIIIPGHGPIGTKEDLQASRDMLNGVYTKLQAFAASKKTTQEVVAAAPTKEFDAQFGKGMKPDQFVTIAYDGLLRHAKK